MNFITSLFIFLIPTLSLVGLQFFPYVLNLFRSSPSQKVQFAPVSSAAASSIWCSECNRGHKCCEIKNLYYFPKEDTFGFVLTEDSNLYGISIGADFGKLLTTSVVNHTQFLLPLVVFSEKDPLLKTVKSQMTGPLFLMERFKPDNLMHALHDDILPLFSRYETLCRGDVHKCTSEILLAFSKDTTDSNSKWYQILSTAPIFKMNNLKEPTLISNVHFGLPGNTVVYQYGFGKPQGPVSVPGSSIGIFQRFAEFARKHFDVVLKEKTDTINVLLITRKETRKILNEDELMTFVLQSFQNTYGMSQEVDIKEIDLNSVNSIRQLIAAFYNSDMIVGMHGAATFVAGLFSKPNATILELFPYGIRPTVVSPLYSLSRSSGSWFNYVSWENKDPRASVPPVEDSPQLIGGLGSLSEEDRNFAKNQVPVPAVHCCHNATYLYRMFQDTRVTPSVQYSILKSIEMMKRGKSASWVEKLYLPGAVRDLVCLSEAEGTKIFWKMPLNVLTLGQKDSLKYEITAKTRDEDLVEVTETKVFSDFEKQVMKEVWVRACNGHGVCGNDKFVKCL